MKTQLEASGLGKPVIFQIVGYQNSGKTTLLSKLISRLTKENWKVVTVKHHGHGGKPETKDDKDSSQHNAAGAVATLVEGGGRLILQAEQQMLTLAEQIQLLSFFNADFLLIEGYKQEEFPKVVLVRNEGDNQIVGTLKNVIAVFYWDQDIHDSQEGVPHFQINDEAGYSWLEDYLLTARLKSKF